MRALVHRVTQLRVFRNACGNGNRLVIDRLLDQHPRWSIAGLASVAKTMQHTARHCSLQIAVGEDNISRLAAQFLCDAFDGIRCIFCNLDTRASRTGKRDHIDFRMAGQCIAYGHAGAVDHVKHALRKACLVHHFSEKLRRQWCHLARFQNHTTARDQRGTDLANDLIDRPVPRGNQHAHANGFVDNDAISTDIILPSHFTHGLDCRTQMTGSAFSLSIVGKIVRRAHFGRDSSDHFAIASFENRNQLLDERNAFIKRCCGIAIECSPRGLHRALDIICRADSDCSAYLLGRGVDRVDRCRGRCGQNPLAIDVRFERRIRHIRWLFSDLQQLSFQLPSNDMPPKNRWGQG